MIKGRVLLTALAGFLAMTAAAHAATVVVTIPNVNSDLGTIRVSVCTREEFLQEDCRYRNRAPAKTGVVIIAVKHVPPGAYAVQVLHDENNNGRMDFDALGIFPIEGYGFSNLGRLYVEPYFADAAIDVVAPKTAVTVTLNYP